MELTGQRIENFFARYLHHRKGERAGEKFHLEPFQRGFLEEFYERDSRGRRVYRYGILGIPRGNGKTPLAAGLGLIELLTRRDSPDVFTVAGSRDQARILLDFARGFVEDEPKLEGLLTPSRNFVACDDNNGRMRVLAAQGSLQHGLNPSCVFIDELHAFTQPQQKELYVAQMTALHKRPDAFLLTITTAGFDKQTILGEAYDQALLLDGEDRLDGCLRIRRDRENGVLFYWYGIPESLAGDWENEELWRLVNPASWVSIESLRKQLAAPGFHELDFKRLHLNMWTAVRESWLPSGAWPGLRSDAEIPDGSEVYVGVDVGFTHDTTAIAWAWRSPEGKVVVRTHVWSVLPEHAHHAYVAGGRMRLELVGDFLRQLDSRYRVREIVFDPTGFAAEADRLAETGLPLFELSPASGAMNEAYQRFYQAVREQTLCHDGDPVLTAHVEATAADLTERGWKIRKLKSTQVIDACVAAVMAHYRAARDEAGPKAPQVFWFDE